MQHDAGTAWTLVALADLQTVELPLFITVVIGSEADRAAVKSVLEDAGFDGRHQIGFAEGVPDAWSTPLISVVCPHQRFRPGTLERHVDALMTHPEATISLTTAVVTDPTRELRRFLSEHDSEPVSGLTDGRALAEALLFNGGHLPIPPVVAARTTSLGDGHLPHPCGTDEGVDTIEWYRFVIRLLTQGPAWLDPEVGVESSVPSLDRALWERWPSIVEAGQSIGLLDRPDDQSRVMIGWTRSAVAMLRDGLGVHRADRGHTPAALAELAATWWSAQAARAAAQRAPLPLHVALVTQEGSSGPPDGVGAPVEQVTVVPTDRRGAGLPARIEALRRHSPLPVVVLPDAERLEVADRSQLLGRLADGVPNTGLLLDTPEGSALRLLAQGRDPTGSAAGALGVQLVHSLRTVDAGIGADHDWLPRRRAAGPQPLHTFVVVAPGYTTRHGGIVALHRLCDRLNAIGYDAFVHPIGFSHEIRPDWLTPLLRGRPAQDMIAIYPETVSGNELGADRVVRWLLNRPGRIHGNTMDEGPNDLLVTFSTQVSDQYPVLSVPLIDPQMFFPKDRPGTGSLLWIGKGVLPAGFNRSGTQLITNGWPRDRSHFGQVLRSADVLYTCDWLTSVIDESLMCGTPVVLIGQQEWTREEITFRPGMAWEGDDLDVARYDVVRYYGQCIGAGEWVDASVEEFVRLANDHFGAVAQEQRSG